MVGNTGTASSRVVGVLLGLGLLVATVLDSETTEATLELH
jgi:hypothetical protein